MVFRPQITGWPGWTARRSFPGATKADNRNHPGKKKNNKSSELKTGTGEDNDMSCTTCVVLQAIINGGAFRPKGLGPSTIWMPYPCYLTVLYW